MIQHKSTIKKIKSTLVLADDPNDNGLAALLSILRFHDDYSTLEELRILSDTNEAGSTLFGLQQAAIKCGYQCKGYKLDTEALKECKHPAILSMTAQQQDFVVFYGTYTVGNQLMYVLKDITKGLVFLNQRQLTKLWGTNFCLVIEPPKDKRPVAPLKKSSVFALLKQEPALVYTIAFFAMLVAALLILPGTFFLPNFIDEWFPEKDISFWIPSFVVIGAIVLGLALEYYRKRLAMLCVIPINNRLADRLFKAFGHLPKPFFESYRSESLAKYNSCLQSFEFSLTQLLGNGFLSIALGILAMILLSLIAGMLVLVIVTMVIVFVWWLSTSNAIKTIAKDEQRKKLLTNKANVLFIEACEIHKKAHEKNREYRFFNRIKQVNSFGLYGNFVQEGKYEMQHSIATFFSAAIMLCSISVNGYLLFENLISIGSFVAGIGLSLVLMRSLVGLFEFYCHSRIAGNSLLQISEMEYTASKTLNGTAAISTIESIAATEVNFLATGFNRLLVKGANFSIEKGVITGIVGANGSGKSILAEILMKKYPYAGGDIIINGTHALQDISSSSWNELAAIVTQQPAVFPGRLLENITMTDARHNIDEVFAFIKEFKLDLFFQQFPKGQLTSIGTANVNISPAQQQIICLARALYNRPQLLILDDFAQCLDPEMMEFAFYMIRQVKVNTCIVFLTSNASLVDKYCDKKFYL